MVHTNRPEEFTAIETQGRGVGMQQLVEIDVFVRSFFSIHPPQRILSCMPIWYADNPVSSKWPLYTRGNVGEVFPEVVLPLTWDLYGQAAEDGWRDAYRDMGLLVDGDIDPAERTTILGVFGGYCYINASYVRLVGVRAPGGKVETIDEQFFGESDAPAYEPKPSDKSMKSTLLLGRTVLQVLRTKTLPELESDKTEVEEWIAKYPAEGSDEDLLGYMLRFRPLFQRLFRRHINNTMAVALASGALVDLLAKVDESDQLVSILGGIGDVESAAPSAAMWKLAHSEYPVESSEWQAEFSDFLDEFGSRGPNEWDLGSDPWEFRPDRALAAIDRMREAEPDHDPAQQQQRLAQERTETVAQVRKKLNPIDRVMFDKALRATTVYSQGRERSKTTIIRAIQSVRRAQRELAQRASDRGGPNDLVESCLLNLDEFASFVSDPEPFQGTMNDRGKLYDQLSALIPPFIVDGEVPPIETWESRDSLGDQVEAGAQLNGIAGCPGVARGRAVVVMDPGDPGDLGPGDVLVAPITDPSWTPLFLAANAVVVDVGATMSHAVIVSRELGIPCVVSATDATRTIPNGATIEVDGNSGTVTVIELP